MIKIANGLELPTDAVTQTFAQIGRKGAGKTYLASMIAEQMLDIKAQIIVLDPIGNWWGLRVDADGVSKGKDIFIIGGAHGDVPLAPEAGKEIAKLLVQTSISAVLDISEFRKNERKRFVTDFAEEFYHLKKSKASPCHIFLEESQKFVPQRPQKDEARMLGAWEDIVRLGRNHGIGCSLISQRPQSINKEVLSQVECLCVLQITGLHERKALEEWVKEVGDQEERKLIGQLPGLHRGEGFVWSPGWLRIFMKVHFSKKTTLDTSATPELGKAEKAAKISKVDVKKLREMMQGVIDKAKKESLDQKTLVDKVRSLEMELKKAKLSKDIKSQENEVNEKRIESARLVGFNEAKEHAQKTFNEMKKEIARLERKLIKISEVLGEDYKSDSVIYENLDLKPSHSFKKQEQGRPINVRLEGTQVTRKSNILVTEESRELNLCARKIYSLLYNNPNRDFSKSQIAFLTGYSVKSGGFNNALSQLNSKNLFEKKADRFSIGLSITEFATENVGEADKQSFVNKMKKCEREIFLFLLENPYTEFSKEQIAETTGYSVNSGGFNNALSKLNTLELIQRNSNTIKLNHEIIE